MNQKLKKTLAIIILFIMCVCNNGPLVIATEIVNTVEENNAVVETQAVEETVEALPEDQSQIDSLEVPQSIPLVEEEKTNEEPKEEIAITSNTTNDSITTDVSESEEIVPTTEIKPEVVEEDTENVVAEEKVKNEAVENQSEEDEKAKEEKIPMPSAEFYFNTGEVEVKVSASEGAFPKGTTMEVTPIIKEAVMSAINDVVDGEVKSVSAVDITFKYEGQEIEPKAEVSVNIKAVGLETAKEQKVVHIDDSFNAKVVNDASVNKVGNEMIADFKTIEFSVYAIVTTDDEGNEQYVNYNIYDFYDIDDAGVPGTPYEFVNKAGEYVTSQKIKNGDIIENVGTPYHPGYVFDGWFISDDGFTYGEQISFTEPIQGIPTNSDLADNHISVYPKYKNVKLVTFYEDEAGTVIQTKKITDSNGDVLISDVIAPQKDSETIFYGWVEGTQQHKIYENKEIVPTTINVTGNTELKPYYVNAYWLRFVSGETGSRASYVPAIFLLSEEDAVTSLPVPTRPGYVFAGWYKGSMENNVITYGEQVTDGTGHVINPASGLTLTEETTLYGNWTPQEETQYKVIFWLQKVTDDKNATAEQKTYDYWETVIRTGTTDDVVTTESGDLQRAEELKSSKGLFHYARTAQTSTTIKADGSTVINVYYDRDLMVINFYYDESTPPEGTETQTAYNYTITDAENGDLYGVLPSGEYVKLTRIDGEPTTRVYYTYNTGGWFSSDTEYTGTFYTRRNNNNYQASQYNGTNNLPPANDNTTYYTNSIWGTHYQLTRHTETVPNYSWQYTDETGTHPYTGDRYTRTQNSNYPTMVTWTGLYGQDFDPETQQFPTGIVWRPNANGTGTIQTFLTSFNEINNPVYNLYDQGASGSTMVYHYKQTLNGNYSQESGYMYTVATSGGSFNFTDKFRGFKVATYNRGTEGFNSNGGSHDAPGNSSNSYPLHIYHTRNKNTIFYMSENQTTGNIEQVGKIENVYYETPLMDPEHPEDRTKNYNKTLAELNIPEREHYEFKGWYADEGCTTPFNFNSTMPDANIEVFAKWEPVYYQIIVNPDGGEINSSIGATYFWKKYNDTFDPYNIQRTYIEDQDGEYKYVYVDGKEDPDGNIGVRTATYELAEPGYTGIRYRKMVDGVDPSYVLIGWYEEDENGNLSSNPYDFNRHVTGPVTIRAKWRLQGEYRVQYHRVNTVDGVEVSGDFTQTDPAADYADLAEVLVDKAPTNITTLYTFDGWYIGDAEGNPLEGNKVYKPGEFFTLHANWAQNKRVNVWAKYSKVETNPEVVDVSFIKFNANGGTTTITTNEAQNILVENNVVTISKQHINTNFDLANYGADKFTRQGYRLLGWSTSPSADEPEFTLDQVVGIDNLNPKDNTLYAVWAKESGYIIHYVERENPSNKLYDDKVVNNLLVGTFCEENALPAKDGFRLVGDGYVAFRIQDNTYEYTFYYTKRTDLSYTVNYLEQGTNAVLHDPKNVGNKTFQESVTENAIDIEGYTCTSTTPVTITIQTTPNIINFYYTKRNDLSYTIYYVDKDTNQNIEGYGPITRNATYKDVIQASTYKEDIDGYVFDSYSKDSITIGVDTAQNVLTIYYTKRKDLTYRINYLDKATEASIKDSKVVYNVTFGTQVQAADEVVAIPGYTYDHSDITTLTVGTDAEWNYINLYYAKRTDLEYTVHYKEQGTETTLAEDKVGRNKTFGTTVHEEAINISGYDKVAPTEADIEITAGTNEYTFYYTKRTNLTGIVHHYEVGKTEDLIDPTELTGLTYQEVLTSSTYQESIPGFTYKNADPETLTVNVEGNVINLYYERRTDLEGIVHHYEVGKTEDLIDPTELKQLKFGDILTSSTYQESIPGFTYKSANPDTLEVKVEGNVINLYYERRTDLTGEVHHFEKGTTTEIADVTPLTNLTFEETLTGSDYQETIDGFTYSYADPETLDVDVQGNVFNLYYERRNNLSYTIHYKEKGTNATVADDYTENNQTFGANINISAIDIDGYTKVAPTSDTITITTGTNEYTFYYEKRHDLSYIVKYVEYVEEGECPEIHVPKTVSNKTYLEEIDSISEYIDIDGYNYKSVDPETLVIKTNVAENVITIYYTKQNDLSYTVYYKEQGTEATLHAPKSEDGQIFNDTVTVSAEDINGYDLVGDPTHNILITTGTNEYTFYYTKKTNLSYTIHYHEEGTEKELSTDKVVRNQTFDAEIQEDAIDIEGYDKVDPIQYTFKIKDGVNEYTFYYKKMNNLTGIVHHYEVGKSEDLIVPTDLTGLTYQEVLTSSRYQETIPGFTYKNADPETLTVDVEGNVINLYYERRTDLSGTVLHYEDGTTNEVHEPTPLSDLTFGDKLTGSDYQETIEGFTYHYADPEELEVDEEDNVIILYYTRKTNLTGEVHYFEKGTSNEIKEVKQLSNLTFGDTLNAIDYKATISGFDYDSADPETLEVRDTGNVINLYYIRKSNLTGEVHHYEDGTTNEIANVTPLTDLTYEEVLTGSDYQESIDGFTYKNADPETLKVDVEGNVINLYYVRRTDLTGEVHHFEKGTTNEIHEVTPLTGLTFEETLTGSDYQVAVDGFTYSYADPETLDVDVQDNVINLYYERRTDLIGEVHHFEKGTTNEIYEVTPLTGLTFEETLTGSDYQETIDGFTYSYADPETLDVDVQGNVINLYYERRTDLTGLVLHYEDGTTNEVADATPLTDLTFEEVLTGSDYQVTVDGFTYKNADPETLKVGTDDNVIILYYTRRTDLTGEVHHFEEGSTNEIADVTPLTGLTFEETLTSSDYQVTVDGFTYSYADPEALKVDVDGNVINLYYTRRSDLRGEVHHFEKGTTTEIADVTPLTDLTFEKTLTGSDYQKTIDGFTYSYSDPETLDVDVQGNVFNLYYERRTDLTGLVLHYEDGTTDEVADATPLSDLTFEEVLTGSDYQVAVDGFTYKNADPETLKVGTDDNVIILYYTRRTDLTGEVHHFEKGTTNEIHEVTPLTGLTFEETLTGSDYQETIDGFTYSYADPETLDVDVQGNVINLYYERRTDLTGLVLHYEDGTTDEVADATPLSDLTFEEVLTGSDYQVTVDGFTYKNADPETLKVGTDDNVIILYYTRRTDLTGEVHHFEKGTTNEIADVTPLTGLTFEDSLTGSDYQATIEGFTYSYSDPETLEVDVEGNVFNLYYERRTDLTGEVHHFEKGTTTEIADVTPLTDLTFEDTLTGSDYQATIDGFTYSNSDPETLKVDIEGNVINLYYTRNSYDYTVNYYYDGELGSTETKTELFDTEISVTPEETTTYNGNSYCLTEIDPENGTIKIQSDTTKNVINVYYELDNLNDKDDTDEPGNPDKIPDKYQIVVNYQVENGKWNDQTPDDKIQVMTLRDPQTNELSKDGEADLEVPGVGQYPNTGYCEGDWTTELPEKVKSNNDGDTYKYVYEEDKLNDEKDKEDPEDGDDIPDKYQIKVNYQVNHGLWNDETPDDKIKVMTLIDPETGKQSKDGEAVLEVPEVGQFPDEGYCEGEWTTELPEKVNKGNNGDTYIYEYLEDKLNDNPEDDDDTNSPDGHPDKYQIVLTYIVRYGLWDDETSESKVDVITLRDPETGKYSKTGEGPTEAPEVGKYPDKGYTEGAWDNEVPEVVPADQNPLEFTYEFVPFEPVRHDPPVKKVIEGDKPTTDDTFVFTLTAVRNTAELDEMPMPEGSQGQTKQVSIVGGGEYEFGWIEFNIPGTYVYQMKEENTGNKNYTYDSSTYTVTYEIIPEGTSLSIERTIEKDGEEADECVFTNTYKKPTPPPQPGPNTTVVTQVVYVNPKTGDDILLWISLMLFSTFAVLEVATTMKKREYEN